jgi:hypothetical protein
MLVLMILHCSTKHTFDYLRWVGPYIIMLISEMINFNRIENLTRYVLKVIGKGGVKEENPSFNKTVKCNSGYDDPIDDLLWNMTRASSWEFEDINEQSFIGITGIVSKHSVVDKFLGALALITWGQQPACRVWSQACFHASSL